MKGGRIDDVQGHFLGMPYDWRMPTLGRMLRRVWNPGGPLLSPKSFGWGYTLNVAHPGAGWVVAAGLAIVLALVIAS